MNGAELPQYLHAVDQVFWSAILIGFVAQSLTMGIATSTVSTAALLACGISPAVASASVHTSEVVNRLVAGLSHLRLGNVDRALFRHLATYGMAGAFCGAFVVAYAPVRLLTPLIASFLLLMGARILLMGARGARQTATQRRVIHLPSLGVTGGFVDVIAGGGWGPLVSSTLFLQGRQPQLVIGSLNLAKFFVAVVESVTLLTLLNSPHWGAIGGLITGGVLAAPLSAVLCNRLPPRLLMVLVGLLICTLSVRTLLKTL